MPARIDGALDTSAHISLAPEADARGQKAETQNSACGSARVTRDKPDYHVQDHPQTETRAGTQNAGGVSPESNKRSVRDWQLDSDSIL